MMNVFKVHTGCLHEGGSTKVVCSTYATAYRYVMHRLKKERKRNRKHFDKFKKRGDDFWTDECDVILIREVRVY